MVTAPFLGAAVDELGRRKGWLALIVAIMCPLMVLLWWLKPDGSGLPLMPAMIIIMLLNVSVSLHRGASQFAAVVRAAGLRNAHEASGLALALGNFFSVLALVFTAYAFALPGKVDWSFLPSAPLFGLDPAKHEPERIVAPIAAIVFAIGSLPFFFFTKDAEPTGIRRLPRSKTAPSGCSTCCAPFAATATRRSSCCRACSTSTA